MPIPPAPLASALRVPTGGAPSHPAEGALTASLARTVLAGSLLLGVAGDILFRDGMSGVCFPLWIALAIATLTSLVWRSEVVVPREARGWLVLSFTFACGIVWRDAGDIQFLDGVASLGALVFAATTLRWRGTSLLLGRVRDSIGALCIIARRLAGGLARVWSPATAPGWRRRATPRIHATLIAIVTLIVFVPLLRSADPIFASLVDLPDVDAGTIISHIFLIGLFAWLFGGLASAAIERTNNAVSVERVPFTMHKAELTAMLGTMNAVFGVFVLSQLGWFFGGEHYLHDRTGLTVAQYARGGFFQMVCVVALVLPLLLVTRAMLANDKSLARRHSYLALPIVAMLGVVILSAVLRMKLYTHYYGLSVDRVDTLAFMGWLGFVLLWLAVTVLRDRGRTFAGGAILSGFAVLALLNLVSPDALVARVNTERVVTAGAPTVRELDVVQLASLSGDATERALAALVATPTATTSPVADANRCIAIRLLTSRWGAGSVRAEGQRADGAWRNWNLDRSRSLDVVAENGVKLRAAMHATCSGKKG